MPETPEDKARKTIDDLLVGGLVLKTKASGTATPGCAGTEEARVPAPPRMPSGTATPGCAKLKTKGKRACATQLMTFYRRNLPHWHPEGKPIFLTWRLYGSLPKDFLGRLGIKQGTGRSACATQSAGKRFGSGARSVFPNRRRPEKLTPMRCNSFVAADSPHTSLNFRLTLRAAETRPTVGCTADSPPVCLLV
jgi:hypothetical protein